MYTFIVVSYNEEKYIFQALESIRYQVENYGKNRRFQIIIADDCSSDLTQSYIEFWLTLYGYLFDEITRIYQQNNIGTCANIVDALRMVHGSLFFSLAGDDMLACTDVFHVIEQNKGIDVLASASLIVRNDIIDSEQSSYMDILAQSLYTSSYISWSVGLGCPIQAGAAWNKRINTENVYDCMIKMRLLDDRPRYYAAWKFNSPIKYRYTDVPLLLYRKNETSASSITGHHRNVLNKDLIIFFKTVRENSKNRVYRLCAYMQEKSAMMRGQKYMTKLRYITPYYFVEMYKRLCNKKKMKREFEKIIITHLEMNQVHIMNLKKKSERLRKSYDNSKL